MVAKIKFVIAIAATLCVCAVVAWHVTEPPTHLEIAPPYNVGPVPEAILNVWAAGDPVGKTQTTFPAPSLRGYDDIVLQEHLNRAFLTGRDGWIWRVNLETMLAERWVDTPLMPAGAHLLPTDDNTLCFCASYRYQTEYPDGEEVGLYSLNIETKEITPLVLRVPNPPPIVAPAPGNDGTVFTAETENRLYIDEMNAGNSRPLAFCNDLDISTDGVRFYFSEPFPYEGASMGNGAIGEAITLGNNGRLWTFDIETNTVALVAQDYNFIDGVLLEPAEGPETSVLITESTKFRILRLNLNGDKAGTDEVLWSGLPGIPDALERDKDGTIWVGMIKKRSGLLTWAHLNPWIKPLLLRLPLASVPVPTTAGVLALSPDASTALWYAEHPGTHVQDIAAVVPGTDGLYLANGTTTITGLHRMPNPLSNRTN